MGHLLNILCLCRPATRHKLYPFTGGTGSNPGVV